MRSNSRFLAALLALLVLQSPLSAQTARFLNPLPSGNSYYAVSFPDTANGWCVGEAGIIVRTTDTGASWLFVESGTDTNLYAVHMLDQTHGWAAGDNTILTAGGTGWWRVQSQSVPAQLRSIRFLDAARGWACGDSLLLSTTNGGTAWATSRLPGAAGLKSVAIADPHHLWLAGDSCLYRSTNGGESWDRFAPDSLFRHVDFQKVVFPSPAVGWLIGTQHLPWPGPNSTRFAGLMLKTADSGSTWSVMLSDTLEYSFIYPRYYFYDLVFADTLVGYYASLAGAFATTNGGAEWDTVHYAGGYHNAMPSAGKLFLAGGEGDIYFSSDKGKTLRQLSRGTRGTIRSLQSFGSRIFAGVSFGDHAASFLLRSDNYGSRWDTISTFPEAGKINLTALSFVDSLHGWCSAGKYYSGTFNTNAGIILRTTDGGRSWKQQLDDSSHLMLLSVHFSDLQHGVAAGYGQILYTTNGGDTWLTRYRVSPADPVFYAAYLRDSTTIWCGGSDRIFSSTDAGLTWKVRDTLAGLPYYAINGIHFTGARGWMVGAQFGFVGPDGIILATTDAGQSWTNVLVVPGKSLNAVDSWNDPGGYNGTVPTTIAVGDKGAFAISQGGLWHTEDLPHIRTDLEAVNIQNWFYSTIGGQYGKILSVSTLGPDAVPPQTTHAAEFRLEQNYPNPFNPSTVITYALAQQTRVKLSIYDLLGREVATLVDELQLAGSHRIRWSPRGLSSGLYFYRLTAGSDSQVHKMLYLR